MILLTLILPLICAYPASQMQKRMDESSDSYQGDGENSVDGLPRYPILLQESPSSLSSDSMGVPRDGELDVYGNLNESNDENTRSTSLASYPSVERQVESPDALYEYLDRDSVATTESNSLSSDDTVHPNHASPNVNDDDIIGRQIRFTQTPEPLPARPQDEFQAPPFPPRTPLSQAQELNIFRDVPSPENGALDGIARNIGFSDSPDAASNSPRTPAGGFSQVRLNEPARTRHDIAAAQSLVRMRNEGPMFVGHIHRAALQRGEQGSSDSSRGPLMRQRAIGDDELPQMPLRQVGGDRHLPLRAGARHDPTNATQRLGDVSRNLFGAPPLLPTEIPRGPEQRNRVPIQRRPAFNIFNDPPVPTEIVVENSPTSTRPRASATQRVTTAGSTNTSVI